MLAIIPAGRAAVKGGAPDDQGSRNDQVVGAAVPLLVAVAHPGPAAAVGDRMAGAGKQVFRRFVTVLACLRQADGV